MPKLQTGGEFASSYFATHVQAEYACTALLQLLSHLLQLQTGCLLYRQHQTVSCTVAHTVQETDGSCWLAYMYSNRKYTADTCHSVLGYLNNILECATVLFIRHTADCKLWALQ